MARKPKKIRPAEWIATSDIANKYSLSSEFFTDRIGSTFERGVHVINCTPNAWRPTYRWHEENVHEWFKANKVMADHLPKNKESAA